MLLLWFFVITNNVVLIQNCQSHKINRMFITESDEGRSSSTLQCFCLKSLEVFPNYLLLERIAASSVHTGVTEEIFNVVAIRQQSKIY